MWDHVLVTCNRRCNSKIFFYQISFQNCFYEGQFNVDWASLYSRIISSLYHRIVANPIDYPSYPTNEWYLQLSRTNYGKYTGGSATTRPRFGWHSYQRFEGGSGDNGWPFRKTCLKEGWFPVQWKKKQLVRFPNRIKLEAEMKHDIAGACYWIQWGRCWREPSTTNCYASWKGAMSCRSVSADFDASALRWIQ